MEWFSSVVVGKKYWTVSVDDAEGVQSVSGFVTKETGWLVAERIQAERCGREDDGGDSEEKFVSVRKAQNIGNHCPVRFNGIMTGEKHNGWRNVMDKRERLEATIAGQSVDRMAVAAWRHQPVDDQNAEYFAAATIAFQREFDFDFVKVTPASSYCLRQWGVRDLWKGHPHGTRDEESQAIRDASEWSGITSGDPNQGQMGEMLRALGLIQTELGHATPFVQTIFSPLTQASKLVGARSLRTHARLNESVLKKALQAITDQTKLFVEAAKTTGISGIFYAMQMASYTEFTEDEYREFGEPYDLQVLESARECWLNIVHLHGEAIMFSLASKYPAAILNWHDRETPPSLEEGLKQWRGAVCGGVRQEATLVRGTPKEIRGEVREAAYSTGGRRLVIGTGCVAPIVAPYGNLMAMRKSVEKMGVDEQRE